MGRARKKKRYDIGGSTYLISPGEVKQDQFEIAHRLVLKGKRTITACCKMAGVSRNGYYAWRERQNDDNSYQKRKVTEAYQIKEKIRQIIKKISYIPGSRTIKIYLMREFKINIGRKRIARYMKEMHLVANLPKKDAYKGQATHFHELCAKQNYVQQDWLIGPRRVILTDITYLYYGLNRTVCYLCAFKDAFTNEILGYQVDSKMDVELIKVAYHQMMTKHGQQINAKKVEAYIHSDQGSQYLSTTFKQLLEDDGFIQSMSRRGNSQDNAPMESFFGRMKTEIIDIIGLCPNLKTVKELIEGYIHHYNDERYQIDIAGLAPSEYYEYVTTGIYPCEEYFGVSSDKLLKPTELAKARKERAAMKAEKRRQAYHQNNEVPKSAYEIIARDQKKIKYEIAQWEKYKERAIKQLKKLNEILEKTKMALKYIEELNDEIREKLGDIEEWSKHEPLQYVNELEAIY